ncbi:hypothetical protein [Alkalihalobacillus sp. TS-13]|uniref:hypothetical protein n=1 Tax=Alkalihalobacillus sp. TS-13 TaxID=2842455 RepID=UPI001C8867CE|nr:hypothetical protein [Alkalihalobacillus sp. TS-13]
MIVGNARDAERILRYVKDKKKETDECVTRNFIGPVRRVKMPEGWELVGRGSFRIAYLSPDRVIYKVQHTYDYEYGQNNYGEFENIVCIFQSRKTMPGVRFPKFTLYELSGQPVMAMEFVKGVFPETYICYDTCNCQRFSGKCNYETLTEIRETFDLFDLHDRNVMFVPEQGEWVIIDVGA